MQCRILIRGWIHGGFSRFDPYYLDHKCNFKTFEILGNSFFYVLCNYFYFCWSRGTLLDRGTSNTTVPWALLRTACPFNSRVINLWWDISKPFSALHAIWTGVQCKTDDDDAALSKYFWGQRIFISCAVSYIQHCLRPKLNLFLYWAEQLIKYPLSKLLKK